MRLLSKRLGVAGELRRHGSYDVVVLSSQLEDMDEGQFIQQMRQLDHKPLLLLSGIKNCHTISSNCLQRDDSYYMIRQMELKHFCREIERLYGGTVPRILEDGCRKLFVAWGLEDQDIQLPVSGGALQIACGSKEHLALRKQLLEQVAQQHQVSVAAVDSGIRRLIDQLEEQCPPAWQRFKRECGLGDGRPTTGKLIYGLRRVLLVATGRRSQCHRHSAPSQSCGTRPFAGKRGRVKMKKGGRANMREVHQQDWLQLDEFPREGFKTVCFHALDLITQNREYLEDHLRKHWKNQQSLDALADLQTAVSQLEGALGEMMALLDCISQPPQMDLRGLELCTLVQSIQAQAEQIQQSLGVELPGGVSHTPLHDPGRLGTGRGDLPAAAFQCAAGLQIRGQGRAFPVLRWRGLAAAGRR